MHFVQNYTFSIRILCFSDDMTTATGLKLTNPTSFGNHWKVMAEDGENVS